MRGSRLCPIIGLLILIVAVPAAAETYEQRLARWRAGLPDQTRTDPYTYLDAVPGTISSKMHNAIATCFNPRRSSLAVPVPSIQGAVEFGEDSFALLYQDGFVELYSEDALDTIVASPPRPYADSDSNTWTGYWQPYESYLLPSKQVCTNGLITPYQTFHTSGSTGIAAIPRSIYGADFAITDANKCYFYNSDGALVRSSPIAIAGYDRELRDVAYDWRRDRFFVTTVAASKVLAWDSNTMQYNASDLTAPGQPGNTLSGNPFGIRILNLQDSNGTYDLVQSGYNWKTLRDDGSYMNRDSMITNMGYQYLMTGMAYTPNYAIEAVTGGFFLYTKRAWQDHMISPSDLALGPEIVSFNAKSALAPSSSNYGQIGCYMGFGTSLSEAMDEQEGKFVSLKPVGVPSYDMTTITNVNYSWGTGERSLGGQRAYLRAPVRAAGPLDGPIGWVRGWVPLWLGHPELEPGNPLMRRRDLTTNVEGSYAINTYMDNVQLRLVATGSMSSYTITELVIFSDNAKNSFDFVKSFILDTKLAAALRAQLASLAAGLTVDLIANPTSAYRGGVEASFSTGNWTGSGTMVNVGDFKTNVLVTDLKKGTTSITTAPMTLASGQSVTWNASFRTWVETKGYAKADAALDGYRVEMLRNGQVVNTVYSWEDPRGGVTGMAMAAMQMADLNGDGIPDSPTEDQDIFNNTCFEDGIPQGLKTGNVSVMQALGSQLPSYGQGFAVLNGNHDSAGFVTKITLPLDAETLYLDQCFLSSSDAIPEEAIFGLAVYDESGNVRYAKLSPQDSVFSALDVPSDRYAFGTGWQTLSLDLSGMQGEVYLVAVLDTTETDGTYLGVGLDNLRSFAAVPVPEPASSVLLLTAVPLLWRRHKTSRADARRL